MKKLICILLAVLFLQSACKKDVAACTDYTQLTDRANHADPKQTNSQALLDTLAKHPEYQVMMVDVEKYGWVVNGNVFYNGLLIFTTGFMFHGDANNNITVLDTLKLGTFNFSLTPTLTYLDAIKLARAQEDFSRTCISYRLGIYNINASQPHPQTINNKLVWLVQGNNGTPYVYLDANTGQVYSKFDGIEF
jgi:hypothetical protein